MKTVPLVCVVSGKKTYVTTEYYNNKLSKFSSKENLDKYYICQDVKKLLEKNLSIKDVRVYLKSETNTDISDEYLKEIKSNNGIDINKTSGFAPLSVFTCFETDKDVKEFLENIK